MIPETRFEIDFFNSGIFKYLIFSDYEFEECAFIIFQKGRSKDNCAQVHGNKVRTLISNRAINYFSFENEQRPGVPNLTGTVQFTLSAKN